MKLAAQLAKMYDAQLVALHEEATMSPGLYNDPAMGPEYLERMNQLNRESYANARRAFDEALSDAGLTGQWRTLSRAMDTSMVELAFYHDLVITGQTAPGSSGAAAEALLLGTGRPTLIVPHSGVSKTRFLRVMIAWMPTRQASRAVMDALPMLHNADDVTVVSIINSDAELTRARDANQALQDYLSTHGIEARTRCEIGNKVDVPDILLSLATDQQTDVIVMGAYGHSKLRELVLGGTTRDILAQMTVPILMSH